MRYLSEKEDKGRKVEDVNHAYEPMQEHGGAWSRLKA